MKRRIFRHIDLFLRPRAMSSANLELWSTVYADRLCSPYPCKAVVCCKGFSPFSSNPEGVANVLLLGYEISLAPPSECVRDCCHDNLTVFSAIKGQWADYVGSAASLKTFVQQFIVLPIRSFNSSMYCWSVRSQSSRAPHLCRRLLRRLLLRDLVRRLPRGPHSSSATLTSSCSVLKGTHDI